MSLEENQPVKHRTVTEHLNWLRNRMRVFHNEARRQAVTADLVKQEYLERVAPEPPGSGRSRETSKGVMMGRLYNTQADAVQAALNSSAYRDAVALQQLYDRWAMREAAILQAEVTYQMYKEQADAKWQEKYGTDSDPRLDG